MSDRPKRGTRPERGSCLISTMIRFSTWSLISIFLPALRLRILSGYDYGPTHLHRLYVSRNTTNSNLLTIKSGELVIASTTIIGRSGSTLDESNMGRVNQLGGTVLLPLTGIELGQSESSGVGNGIWDYRGGTLEVSLTSGSGLRLSHGRSDSGAGGTARFIMHNPDSGGYVRVLEYHNVSFRGAADGEFSELDPDGVTRGVATTEFHLENGGVRPIQVVGDVVLNNGVDPSTQGIMSTRLELVLDEAPRLDGDRASRFGVVRYRFWVGLRRDPRIRGP